MRPKRISIGCYAVYSGGREIVIARVGRSGFRIVPRPGMIGAFYRRLRDAAAAASESGSPWPFTVAKVPDAGDIPWFLDRRHETAARGAAA